MKVEQLKAKRDFGLGQLEISVSPLLKKSLICGFKLQGRYFTTTFKFKAVQSSQVQAFTTHFLDNFR